MHAKVISRGLRLIQLLQFDTFVIFLENLFVRGAFQSHPISANLAHADAVAPATAVKRHADDFAARVPLGIEIEEAVTETKQCAETKRADGSAAIRADDFSAHRTLGRTTLNNAHLPEAADIQRPECGVQLLPRFVGLP